MHRNTAQYLNRFLLYSLFTSLSILPFFAIWLSVWSVCIHVKPLSLWIGGQQVVFIPWLTFNQMKTCMKMYMCSQIYLLCIGDKQILMINARLQGYSWCLCSLMKHMLPENKCMKRSLSKLSLPCEQQRPKVIKMMTDYASRYCTGEEPKDETMQSQSINLTIPSHYCNIFTQQCWAKAGWWRMWS